MSRERRDSTSSGSGGLDGRPSPQPPGPGSDGNPDDLVDAAWLYTWSAEALRPAPERLNRLMIAAG